MKVVTVIGARPQFIKAAAVSREFSGDPDIREVIIHTGQHFDANMSDIFFEEMHIPRPDYHLQVNSLGHGAMTGRMLEQIEEILLAEKPDSVLVYGDTNSTLAGALAAKKLHISVVHVEAGLRSFNNRMPEEVNRILTDRISDILCCPTEVSVRNLRDEGYDRFDCRIEKTGDVMQDAALYYSAFSAKRSCIMASQKLEPGKFVLCTVHRAENTDDPERLASIVQALNRISEMVRVVMPLHPRTRKIIDASSRQLAFDPLDPLGYFDMIELLKHTRMVLTDSGGLQKEAFFFRKPCVTLRDETEWTELVECGANRLAGASTDAILAAFEQAGIPAGTDRGLYGNGDASRKIANLLKTGMS